MSINKMLIDATHPEETRVVVLRENRVEEFDYESAARKLLRGSIYLAKITRVEPSLQAAFVDYGGNRHGFLAFAEIHPDYYQIPHADKMALLEQESRDQAAYDNDLDDDEPSFAEEPTQQSTREAAPEDERTQPNEVVSSNEPTGDVDDHDFEASAIDVTDLLPAESGDAEAVSTSRAMPLSAPDETIHADAETSAIEMSAEDTHVHITADENTPSARHVSDDDDNDNDHDDDDHDEDDIVESLNDDNDDDDIVATVGLSDDDDDDGDDDSAPRATNAPARRERTPRPRRRARQYKIQEVIKRRQIVLIQVVKEERGNKGAALTTYLSLAGRYTVLMPNTARGGGISRKITNIQDRKRLKAIAQELEVPEGMGLIIRTAGAARTKQEIKRDFEYLLRLWENVRSLTLESTAPSLVYEEGNLIKRSIRDLYTKEIDEVVVAGDEAHNEAKNFMRMLMPSHAKNVVKHEDTQSLFAKYRIESQLNQMFSPNVQLKSGGYLVINQTEALVAIDVNSGKSTREFSIEETALNTNLEAAEELSRQLKLRDLAGLIVVDFIDMEEKRNNRAVERCLKDALRADRARIQVGRISHFGLLEMSRQRLRTGVLEGSTAPCEHCQGSGIVRSIESVSLAVLRGLEDALVAGKMTSCVASCSDSVALYLLNQKRAFIQELEDRYGVVVHIRSSSKQQGANFLIEQLHGVVAERPRRPVRDAINIDAGFTSNRVADNDDDETETEEVIAEEAKPRRRRRRRGRREDNNDTEQSNDRDDSDSNDDDDIDSTAAKDADSSAETSGDDAASDSDDRPRRSRRRGRRGGRRHREQRSGTGDVAEPGAEQPSFVAVDERTQHDDHSAETDGAQTKTVSTAASNEAEAAPTSAAPAARDEASASEASQEKPQLAEVGSTEPQTQEAPVAKPTETAISAANAKPEQFESVAARMETIEPRSAETTATDTISIATADDASTAEAPTDSQPDEKKATVETPSRAARSQPVASEPVLQRVTVGPTRHVNSDTSSSDAATAAEPDAEAQSKPSRKGWWQRQFGG